jgi:hypothetical protein
MSLLPCNPLACVRAPSVEAVIREEVWFPRKGGPWTALARPSSPCRGRTRRGTTLRGGDTSGRCEQRLGHRGR